MYLNAFVIVCLACVGHARRVPRSGPAITSTLEQSDLVLVGSVVSPASMFASLLLAENPLVAFAPSASRAGSLTRKLRRQAPIVGGPLVLQQTDNVANVPFRSLPPAMLFGKKEETLEGLRKQLNTVSWLSWWTQAILTTISGVLLLFGNSVGVKVSFPVLVGRFLATFGIACSAASTLWTWGYRRLAGKLRREPETPLAEAAQQTLTIANTGILINLASMGCSLFGAEAIVGTLAAKALTQSQPAVLGVGASPVQALDMLIVQANTNTLLAQFAALTANLWLRGRATKCAEAPSKEPAT